MESSLLGAALKTTHKLQVVINASMQIMSIEYIRVTSLQHILHWLVSGYLWNCLSLLTVFDPLSFCFIYNVFKS